MRQAEAITAAMFVAIAAVAMFDTRAGALIDTTGRAPGGIGAGFYPFWASAILLAGGLVVLSQAVTAPLPGRVFQSRVAVSAITKLVAPMLVATAALAWLGLYLVSGLYMAFFARFIGRYRWIWVVVLALAFPTAIYLTFELAFRVRLPKSSLYVLGLPF